MSSREGSNQGPWQIKRVNSETGPCPDAVDGDCGSCGSTTLSNAMWVDYNVTGQTEVLWRYPTTKRRLTLHVDPTHDDLGDEKVTTIDLIPKISHLKGMKKIKILK